MQNKAVIIGSTGLIGSYLLEYLLNSEQYTQVIAFVRTPLSSKNNKLTYIETDFNHLDQIASHINGSCLFICIGSTMAKAGSKEAFLKVDYDIPVNVAHIAQKNGVASCVVVSSLGANANSNNFYLQTKGKMEQAIEELGFQKTIFMRPSLLFGARQEFRLGELIGKFMMKVLGPIFLGPFKKYRGIHSQIVAKAMLKVSLQEITGVKKFESNEIEML
jgi:uncharacterized protein YbjT (DUF2867 family)